MTGLPVLGPTALARDDPPDAADERAMLEGWLEYHRATLLLKCSGMDGEQLACRSVEPSSLSLVGLVRHMTEVERHWFRYVLAGEDLADLYWSEAEPDGDFDLVDPARAGEDIARHNAEVEACRAVAARHPDLDALAAREDHGRRVQLRWIYLHMIEEYARHNGHADLLRERIDGVTGE